MHFGIIHFFARLPRKASPGKKLPPKLMLALPPMRRDEGVANFMHPHLFGGGCATDTTVTEMVRSLGGNDADSTIADIRRVVQDVSYRYKRRSLDRGFVATHNVPAVEKPRASLEDWKS